MKAFALAAALLAAAPALAQTPYVVRDPAYGWDGINPGGFQVVGEKVFYTAQMNNGEYRLWISDGTQQGTYPLDDVRIGITLSRPEYFITLGGRVCFNAINFAANEGGVWCSNGTASGTQLVSNAGDLSRTRTVFRDRLYFWSYTSDRYKLGSTDGTTGGTRQELDLSSLPGATWPLFVAATESKLYLCVRAEEQFQLWATDDPLHGFTRVHFPEEQDVNLQTLRFWSNRVLYTFTDTSTGLVGTGITDGSPQGTSILSDRAFLVGESRVLGDVFVLGGSMFATDGTAAGTRSLGAQEQLADFFFWKDELWFAGQSAQGQGYAFWSTDGTPQGTASRFDLPDLFLPPSQSVATGEQFFFVGQKKGDNIYTLHVSDGTGAGTHAIEAPDRLGSVGSLARAGSRFFFAGFNRESEVWDLWGISDAVASSSSESTVSTSALAVRSVGARSVELTTPAGSVRVEAFDLLGRRVATLHDGDAPSTLRLALPPGLGVGAYVVWATAATGETASALVRAR